ncbi:carbohydrate ABC transporter permease [Paenibacillus eucommiae]|uniref:ABC-type glycerol-3-phosphate transport system permease component n=1 Tax=Paenibacillus eucommiae TaxID=1355755 RepID=A0ABS4J217_9BACL|nr:carbohydrate ABC transporter permease [Paenibacillus eucommiae]MBP1993872.1 ABC-type glycerol-3-phosphate transport system permease component [Paenibacillus eucommiae]
MSNKRVNVSETIFYCCNYALFVFLTIACIYPFYYILIYSISDPTKAAGGLFLLPKGINFVNYENLLNMKIIYSTFLISLLRTIIGTLITVACCTFFSYIVTKQELYFRKLIYRFVVITLYFNAGLIPWYLTMKLLHLDNNFLLYVLPMAINGFYIVLIKTFIEQLPAALEESAMMDGAGYLKIFRNIIVPLSMPIIATIAVFAAVDQWNAWQDNYFLVTKESLQTLQVMLYNYLNSAVSTNPMDVLDGAENKVTPESIKMTMTMIVTLPILLVYPFMQRFFVKGIMLGAVKG